MKIKNFIEDNNTRFVAWIFNEQNIRKIFLNEIQALPFKNLEKILIIGFNGTREKAVIYNGEGSVKCKIVNPDPTAAGFGDVYYVNNELTLINRWKGDSLMKACVIDEDGKVIRVYETR